MRGFIVIALSLLAACATREELDLPDENVPTARAGHAIIAEDTGDLLLFAGFAGEETFNGIWQRDHEGWKKLGDAPYAPRSWSTYTSVEHKSHVLMFGGKTQDRVPFDETWVMDHGQWTQHLGDGPDARSHHTAVYDERRNKVVLFGGDDGNTFFQDTWEWDGANWRNAANDGPPARSAHMSAWDPIREMVVIAGGVAPDNETRLQDVWGWDGEVWVKLPNLPASLALASASSTPDGVVLLGGWETGFVPTQKMRLLDAHGWRESSAPFVARSGSASVYSNSMGGLMLSGGLGENFEALADFWILDETGWRQSEW